MLARIHMPLLPRSLRLGLLATAAMNAAAVVAFHPTWGRPLRQWAGFPDGPPLYLALLASFVGVFAVAYAVVGWTGREDRTFLGVAAGGKLVFALLLVGAGLSGEVPLRTALSGLGDLGFGAWFAAWLWTTRRRAVVV